VDFPARFKEKTGLTPSFFASVLYDVEHPDGHVREYGNCILSRWPLSHVTPVLLTPLYIPNDAHIWEREQRSALIAKVEAPKPFWCVVVHLAYSPHFSTSVVRKQQVEVLVQAMKETIPAGEPVVVGGDLNAGVAGDDIVALRNAFTLQTSNIGPTWPLGGDMAEGRPPFITIDHIFTCGVKVTDVRKRDYADLTDHSLVVAEVEIS
jgi:endonuclease/exonuclease/phosphatase family metal-dependent hydrolase